MNPNQNEERKLIILDIEDTQIQKKKMSLLMRIQSFIGGYTKISLHEKVVFFRLMATMTNSGMSVIDGLKVLRQQSQTKKMQFFYDALLEQVRSGFSLSSALRWYYWNFWNAECALLEAGEKTGKLRESLIQIANQTEKNDAILRKLKWALTYPTVLFLGVIGVVVLMMVKVIPSLLSVFGDAATLPASTQRILNISHFLQKYWKHILLVLLITLFCFLLWKKTKNGAYLFDKYLLRIPIFGNIIQKTILARFARVFSDLLGSGVAMIDAIKITSSIVGNEAYRQRLILLKYDVRNGMKVAESLESDPLFPDLLVAMLRVGEETGQIGSTVIKIAEFYEDEVDVAISSIQKLIEPIILVIMGIVIWLIAMSIFEPMMNMATRIGG